MGSDHRVGRVLRFSPVVGIGTPPTLHPQASVPPPPFGSGGRGKLAGERGGERVPIPTRGHTLWYSVYMYFLVRTLGPAATIGQFLTNGNQCVILYLTGGFFWIFYLLFMHFIQHCFIYRPCVGGCWDWTQDSCDFGVGFRRSSHSAKSHPYSTVSSHFREDAMCAKFRGEIEKKVVFLLIFWSCEVLWSRRSTADFSAIFNKY